MEVNSIYKEFHRQLLRYIKGKIASAEDAEDILQNVFIKISSNVSGLADEVKLKSWIFAITRHAIIDYYRTNANRKKIAVLQDAGEDIPDEEGTDSTRGLDQCLGGMIGLLPDEYRDIVKDSEIKGITQKKLAEDYGMAYPSMRSRVQRGREKLKQLLLNCCHIETDQRGNVMDIKSNQGCGGSCDTCS